MSGIAFILKQRGYSISGSDKRKNNVMKKLKSIGITIFDDQKSSNITQIFQNLNEENFVIVISSAISKDNPELKEAYKNNLEVLHRSDILSFLIKKYQSILVAGTHGKTTTSSFISTLFLKNDEDPTVIIGGILPHYKSNSYLGKSKFIIAEIDESDGTHIKYNGDIAVITNLELDHTNHYKDMYSLTKSMNTFANNSQYVIANYDCPNLQKYLTAKAHWCSTVKTNGIDFAAIPISMDGNKTEANYYEKGNLIDSIIINIPGNHNLNNTLLAIAASRLSGISFSDINKNLSFLKRPSRRFEFKGIWNGRKIVDDYAHHPTEIRETISMARLIMKEDIIKEKIKRLIIIFQPHRYSRLQDLMDDFANNLGAADFIILAPIYSAGESKIKGISNSKLRENILEKFPNKPIIISKDFSEIKNILSDHTNENDLILIMGAGDITTLSNELTNNKNFNSYHAA